MTLTQLRYLVAVADHRHFGKAADACAISQPTLSAQLRKLEDELQAALIERGATNTLTSVGNAVVSRARGILSEADEITSIARRGEEPLAGPRRIGIIPTLCPYLLPWALPALKSEHPRLDLICREVMTGAVLAAIKSRELDWGLIAEEPNDPALVGHALFQEPFFAALPPGHSLATRKTVPQTELCDERILVLGEGHCLRDQTQTVCNAAPSAGDDIQATSLETLRGLVAAGQGVTLLPALARREVESGLELRPLRPAASRTVYLITRRADPRRSEASMFAATLRNAAPTAVKVIKPS
jgi:LysR family hydrogen peroxide-inducible transcriptional activator